MFLSKVVWKMKTISEILDIRQQTYSKGTYSLDDGIDEDYFSATPTEDDIDVQWSKESAEDRVAIQQVLVVRLKQEVPCPCRESKVQKIDDNANDSDPFLNKASEESAIGHNKKHRPPNLKTDLIDGERDNDYNSAKELRVNGNVVIYMPPKDETTEMIKYKNVDGLVTPVSFDNVDGPNFPKKKQSKANRCCLGSLFYSPQICINVILGLGCVVGVLFGVLSYVRTNHRSEDASLFCYPCDSIKHIEEKYRKDNMCCISEPLKDFKSTSESDRMRVTNSESYNGSRIVEFEADFLSKSEDKNINWRPSASIANSFIEYTPNQNLLTLTHDGTYVVTVSLTTDTFTANEDDGYIRVLVCLVFETVNGDRTEECRLVTHTQVMNIPFQIIKYRELATGTKIFATINRKEALNFKASHNKMYIVML